MKVTPRTEAEVAQSSRPVWPAGEYDFEIVKATDKTSKSGNEMIETVLKVFNAEGEFILVFDYLMDLESMAFKIKHCCEAIGISQKYEAGEVVADDLVTGTGRLKLKIDKSKDEKYGDKNAVVDYLVQTGADAADPEFGGGKRKKADRAKELDDTIPF